MNQKVTAKPKGIIIFVLLFFIVVLFFLTGLFYTEPELRIFLFFFISFVLYGIYFIFKRYTYLKVGTDFIKHGLHSKYTYDEVEKVELYDFRDYSFLLLPMKEECLTIIFKDGNKVMLEDSYYKNLWKIRLILENKIKLKNDSFNFNFDDGFDSDEVSNKTTKISFFVKLTPYLLYFFFMSFMTSAIFMYFDIIYPVSESFLMPSIIGLVALLIFMGKGFYMESCDEGIFIKNLVSKRVNKKIALDQIESIKLKTIAGGRSKTTLLVIHMKYHKDYQFAIDFIKYDRVENIIDQVKKLNIDFYDLRY